MARNSIAPMARLSVARRAHRHRRPCARRCRVKSLRNRPGPPDCSSARDLPLRDCHKRPLRARHQHGRKRPNSASGEASRPWTPLVAPVPSATGRVLTAASHLFPPLADPDWATQRRARVAGTGAGQRRRAPPRRLRPPPHSLRYVDSLSHGAPRVGPCVRSAAHRVDRRVRSGAPCGDSCQRCQWWAAVALVSGPQRVTPSGPRQAPRGRVRPPTP